MRTFFRIAWRNVRRNIRRSSLTVLIIAFGLGTLIISNALYDGYHEKMISNIVQIFIGHIQIHAAGFHANPSVEKCFDGSVADIIPHDRHIIAFARRVRFQALASTSTNSGAVTAIGIEPEKERTVTIIEKSVVSGRYFDKSAGDANECLAGEQLMFNLQLRLGEKLVLISQGIDGSMAADAFRIVGVCRTGNPDIDRSFVWIPIRAAQRLLNYGNKISEIALLCDRADRVEDVQAKIKARIDKADMEVLNWKEAAPDILQLVELDLAMQTILTAIIAAIVALAVMNTMLMAIQERYTEFGIMAAIGAKPRQIIGMVVSESFFLGLIGIVAGLIISMLGFLYFGTHGVNLASFSEGVAKFIGLKTVVYPVVKVKQVVLSCLFVLASSTFIALLPAVRAVRLDAVQAIRHI